MYKETTYAESLRELNKRLDKFYERANSKNMECDLDLYTLSILLAKDCVYCGGATTGLDRKDNTKGYTVDNCVPACRRCNSLKGADITYAEMLVMGYEIQQCEAGDDGYYLDDRVDYEF